MSAGAQISTPLLNITIDDQNSFQKCEHHAYGLALTSDTPYNLLLQYDY